MPYFSFKLIVISFVIIASWFFVTSQNLPNLATFDIDPTIADEELKLTSLPDTRPFLMSFTNQPFDWNEEAFKKTAELIQRHADTITIFFDVGVPWREAHQSVSYHPTIEDDFRRQQNIASDFEHVIVLASFLAEDRVSLAGPVHENSVMKVGISEKLDFNEPQIIQAYLNYCRDLIKRFQPDYFGYVAEVDAAFTKTTDERFIKLKNMAQEIYTTLKHENPNLPIFIEFTLGDQDYMAQRKDVIAELLPFTDIYALSTYPARFDSIAGNASKLSKSWFTEASRYAADKPIAILETGFHAEPFMHPTLGIKVSDHAMRLLIPGGQKSQALFTKTLLEAAYELDLVFVNQWTIHDLDALFELIEQSDPEASESMLRLASDMGLYDQDSNPRPSLRIWDAWFHLPSLPHSYN